MTRTIDRRTTSSRGRAIAPSVAVALLAGTAAGQTVYNWVPLTNGNWITPGNWSVPGSFPNSASAQAVINAVDPLNPGLLYTVSLANGVTAQSVMIDSPQATLSINPGGGLTTTGPINVQRGTLFMHGGNFFGPPSAINIVDGASMVADANTTLPFNSPLSLTGDLEIRSSTFQYTRTGGLTNNGRITLKGISQAWLFMGQPLTNANTLTIDPIPGGSHQLSAGLTNIGAVNVNGNVNIFSGNTNNQGVFNINNSVYNLATRSFTQAAGMLNATGDASINATGFTASGGTIVGPLTLTHPAGSGLSVNLSGGVEFDSISMNGNNGGGILSINGPASGTIKITLPFTLFANTAGFDTGLDIEATNDDPFANESATVPGTITNNGRFFFFGGATPRSQGITVLPGGNFVNGPSGRMGGRCRHDCTNNPGGTFVNQGTLDLRSRVARLAEQYLELIVPNTNFTPTSQVEDELRLVPGTPTIGTMSVSGNITLNGSLHVSIVDGYLAPVEPARFPIITAASVTGTFANVQITGGRPDDLFAVEYTPTQVVLTARSPCPCAADFDHSGGTPDGTDIAAFFAAWLLGLPTADVDCSGGTPDGTDISLFFEQWLAGGC